MNRNYAGYVGYYNVKVDGVTNPTTNTDIFLSYLDPGATSWSAPVQVNDDNAQVDGYSQANDDVGKGDEYNGRSQYQPEIAVDQATGTVVLDWRDARDDAANARVATYITTSINGGATFSPQTYANPADTAVDAITNQTEVLGPLPDNESAGNPQQDAGFGFGNQMGLAVFNGQVYPIWAGNFNQGTYDTATGAIVGNPLNIWYRPMVIAAGPRIISSSMGPIPLAEAASGSVSVSVTFDRPVDPATFVPGDVQAFFHDTTNGSPSVPLTVTGVNTATTNFTGTVTSGSRFVTFVSSTTGLFYKETITGIGIPAGTTIQNIDSANDTITLSSAATVSNTENLAGIGSSTYGYTQFTITFNPTPAGANPATYNYTGTYSYLIAPDNGAGLAISSPIGAYIGTTPRTADPMDQNADGTSDQNAVTTPFVGTTPGDVYAVPTPQPTTAMQFFGAASILNPPFDQNTLPLIVPGPQVLSTSVPGGDSANGNLITDGTTSTLNVTFDRPMVANTAPAGQTPTPGSFTAADVLQIMGPTGSVSGPQYFPSSSSTAQIIPAAASTTSPGVLNSPLTVPSYGGTFKIAQITVELTAAFSPNSSLTAVLIAPDGTKVPLFSGVGGSNLVNTVLDDTAENSITTGTAPFTGTYRPTGTLSTLDGHTVDMQNSVGQWVPGVWTLQITNSKTGTTGMLDNWSLNITPMITVTALDPTTQQPTSAASTTLFQIGFPLQQLSGTYTIQLGPNIEDTFGDQLDTKGP